MAQSIVYTSLKTPFFGNEAVLALTMSFSFPKFRVCSSSSGAALLYRPYSHKLLTINNYVNCPSNFAFARSIYLFHPLIFEKILMRIQSIQMHFSMMWY